VNKKAHSTKESGKNPKRKQCRGKDAAPTVDERSDTSVLSASTANTGKRSRDKDEDVGTKKKQKFTQQVIDAQAIISKGSDQVTGESTSAASPNITTENIEFDEAFRRRHGAYKRTFPNEAKQGGDETNPPLPPMPAIEAVEQDERDQETARPLIEPAVEMEGNNSQLSGELTAATARSVDQRVLHGEAPEQVTETPQHPSDVENDWEGNHDSGTREDLTEDLEESGMESSQPPCDIGEETSSNLRIITATL
jgi:hypothetical protein